jgi:hypothetical protein
MSYLEYPISLLSSFFLNKPHEVMIDNTSMYEKSHLAPALCHPRVDAVTKEVDGYFLDHWPFPDAKSRKKFVAAGFSRVTCLYFPKALNDRIHFACRLLTVLFLIDGREDH